MTTAKPVKAWMDSAGILHATIEGWRQAEVHRLLQSTEAARAACLSANPDALLALANDLIAQEEDLLAILTTGPRTRPKARKLAATTNPRRAARTRATAAQAAEGFQEMHSAVDAATA